MRKFNYIYLLLLLPFILLFGCEQEEGYDVNVGPKPTLNTMDLLYELGNYSSFLKAVELTGMGDELTGTDAKTVFAPNNAAFEALLAEMGVDKLEDVPTETLANIVSYHIATGATRSESLPRKLTTMFGESPIYSVKAEAGTVLNGKALVVQGNRTATNGVVQGIGFVLNPPAANLFQEVQTLETEGEGGRSFDLLLHAIERAGLSGTLTSSTNYTLLAPTDEAFAAAGLATTADIDAIDPETLASILSYHLLDSARFSQEFSAGRLYTTAGGAGVARGLDVAVGDAVSFSGSAISNPNHVADNGVVHVVNSLVQPYPYLAEFLLHGNPDDYTYYATNSFYKGVAYAGLADKFKTEDRYHLLSPTDYATLAMLYYNYGVTSWDGITEEQAAEIVNRHTFDSETSIVASVGSKITNILGESYFVTENARGYSINGNRSEEHPVVQVIGDLFYVPAEEGFFPNPYLDASEGIYNGTVTSITRSLDRMEPLPAETLTEVMANDPNVSLFAAALEKTGILEASQLYTVFAVPNSVFAKTVKTGGTGYATVEDIEAIDPSTEEGTAAIQGLTNYLNRHISQGLHFTNDMMRDLPVVSTAAGEFKAITTTVTVDGTASTRLAIQDATQNPATAILYNDTDNLANNGVYHVIERAIVY